MGEIRNILATAFHGQAGFMPTVSTDAESVAILHDGQLYKVNLNDDCSLQVFRYTGFCMGKQLLQSPTLTHFQEAFLEGLVRYLKAVIRARNTKHLPLPCKNFLLRHPEHLLG